MDVVWDGQWVSDRLGVRLEDGDAEAPLAEWVGLALRRRSARAHLLVSHVLGKHIPVDPRQSYGLGMLLGARARKAMDGEPAVVIGYAETATALGHAVADELNATCLHSTRRAVAGLRPLLEFEESHSHAPGHALVPEDPRLLGEPHPVVLVDDELSTGHTAMNTIRVLQRLCPRERYVITTMVDVRSAADRALMAEFAGELGIELVVARATSGAVHVPAGAMAHAAELLAGHPPAPRAPAARPGEVQVVDPGWPTGVREGGRHGFTFEMRRQMEIAARGVAARLSEQVRGDRLLVLGSEELMHAPMVIACSLAEWAREGQLVHFSSTTRSPVAAIDEPGYAIRTALSFPAHDGGATGERYLYNVAPASGAHPYTDVVLIVDDVADTAALWASGGLVGQLTGLCERVFVVTLPTYLPPGA